MSNIQIFTEIICQLEFQHYLIKIALHILARMEYLLADTINFPGFCLTVLIKDENKIFKMRSVHSLYFADLEGLQKSLWQFNG